MCTVPPIFSSRSVSSVGLVDRLVEPERELAERARALVGVERGAQELLAALGLGLDAAPGLEAQARALDALAAPGRGHRERHDALGRVLARAGEDLAVGQVVAPGGADPAAAADAQAQVGALGHDAQLVDRFEAARRAASCRSPWARQADDGIGLVELERARRAARGSRPARARRPARRRPSGTARRTRPPRRARRGRRARARRAGAPSPRPPRAPGRRARAARRWRARAASRGSRRARTR